jgi:hypothetical protein
MIVLLYKYIIKYVVFDYLPDEDKFPACCLIYNFGIISQVERWKQDKIKIFLKPKCENQCFNNQNRDFLFRRWKFPDFFTDFLIFP